MHGETLTKVHQRRLHLLTGSRRLYGHNVMAISFEQARSIIGSVANERASRFAQDGDLRPLDSIVGRTVRNHIDAPLATPTYDQVSVEGYAVVSSQVKLATTDTPLKLRCMGVMKAGDAPLHVDNSIIEGMVCCVEVLPGAAFPVVQSTGKPFDGIVPREHAVVVQEGGSGRVLRISQGPLTAFHKRIAGSDFHKQDRILEKGTCIAPKYVMALASVGIRELSVTRMVRVGIITVGSELTSTVVSQQALRYKIPDANGPYLTAAIREMGEDAVYLGALPDDGKVLTAFIKDKMMNDNFDVFVTTGGVASGQPSSVERALSELSAQVHFRNVAMEPGGTLLFASLPGSDSLTDEHPPSTFYEDAFSANTWSPPKQDAREAPLRPALFALPGSPIASACCFRFAVTPYIRALIGMQTEQAIMAKVWRMTTRHSRGS